MQYSIQQQAGPSIPDPVKSVAGSVQFSHSNMAGSYNKSVLTQAIDINTHPSYSMDADMALGSSSDPDVVVVSGTAQVTQISMALPEARSLAATWA